MSECERLPKWPAMTRQDMVLPTRMFMEFCMFKDKRPAQFTTPNHTVAINFSWAAANTVPVNFDYAEFILELLTKKKRQTKISYLGAPEVLTRIAYQAIGKADRRTPLRRTTADGLRRLQRAGGPVGRGSGCRLRPGRYNPGPWASETSSNT